MRSSDGLPTVAIVGRPNVGKSTLFNRIVGQRVAVVHDEAGVTRDRNYSRADWSGRRFWLVDTGGVTLGDGTRMELQIREQVEAAIEECDVVLLLLDARVGLTADDEEVVRRLVRTRKPIVVAANKADEEASALEAAGIVPPGLDAAIPIAATGGRGIGDLLDALIDVLPEREAMPEPEEGVVYVAIVGRPNVGKSSLTNAILGENKMIVSEVAGTTRDSVDTPLEIDGRRYVLVDTAGIRKRGRVHELVEYWSSLRSVRAIERCDVAVVVLDATEPVADQDVKIAAEAAGRFRSVILVANKWDAVEKDPDVARRYEERLAFHFKFLPDAPLVYASALTKRRVDRILPEAGRLAAIANRRIPTSQVNEVLRRIVAETPPPSGRSARLTRVFYATQVAIRPPTFAVFTNHPENVEGHYVRFLRNRFKDEFGFAGAHLKVVVRKREREPAE
ncbi:MAG: ribosome biogenesis GTPase Der [Gemmatimonadetes bacterium]|nr:ribosome biogenesis GTPase Der [Gemmatimonadota bacterium]